MWAPICKHIDLKQNKDKGDLKMELKRYVLTTRKNIIDVSDGLIYGNGHIGKFVLEENMLCTQYDEKSGLNSFCEIIKTSDNMLDLVEVGDLVEFKLFGIQFVKEMYIGMYDELYINDLNTKYFVLSIYKLKPNGDYQKYEIKGEIK